MRDGGLSPHKRTRAMILGAIESTRALTSRSEGACGYVTEEGRRTWDVAGVRDLRTSEPSVAAPSTAILEPSQMLEMLEM